MCTGRNDGARGFEKVVGEEIWGGRTLGGSGVASSVKPGMMYPGGIQGAVTWRRFDLWQFRLLRPL